MCHPLMLNEDRLKTGNVRGQINLVGDSLIMEKMPEKIMIICSACNSFDEFT